MDINTITAFISNVGFPIAVCAFLFWESTTTREKFREALDINTQAIVKMTTVVDSLVASVKKFDE